MRHCTSGVRLLYIGKPPPIVLPVDATRDIYGQIVECKEGQNWFDVPQPTYFRLLPLNEFAQHQMTTRWFAAENALAAGDHQTSAIHCL